MSAILKLIGGPLGSYALIAVAVILAGMAITIKVQHGSNVELRDKLAASKASLDSATSANASQSTAITALEKSYRDLKQACTVNAEIAITAADRAEQFAADRDRLAAQLATLEAKDHATPECTKLLVTDLAAVCPNIASGLRDRANHR